jgi:ABC-type branched-subunit amino acid transport system substrate-binding protein
VSRQRYRLAAGALAGLAITACGSTVQARDVRTLGGPADDGVVDSSAQSGTSPTGGLGNAPSGGTASVPGGGTQAPGTGQLPTGPQPTSVSSPQLAAGANRSPLKIGIAYSPGSNSQLAALGFGGIVLPDFKAMSEILIKQINKDGGIAGRQIEPVWYEYNSTDDAQTQDRAACEYWSHDHRVFVATGVTSGDGVDGDPLACLAKNNIPWLGHQNGDARYWATYPRYLYSTYSVNHTLGLQTLVQALSAQGFFAGQHALGGAHRIGLVQDDVPMYDHAVDEGLVPELTRHGLKLTERVKLDPGNNIVADARAAELRFSSANIDRVIFMSPGGGGATWFMHAAQSQGYKPRYGLWSADSPFALETTAPDDQLRGSVGFGFRPVLDVDGGQDPTAGTPAAKACLKVFTAAGFNTSGNNGSAARSTCDIFFSLAAAVRAAPGADTDTGVLERGFDALGRSFKPAIGFSTRFTASRHDGSGGYRYLVYDSSCQCFRYSGPTHNIS